MRVTLEFADADRGETFEALLREGALLVLCNEDGDLIEFDDVTIDQGA